MPACLTQNWLIRRSWPWPTNPTRYQSIFSTVELTQWLTFADACVSGVTQTTFFGILFCNAPFLSCKIIFKNALHYLLINDLSKIAAFFVLFSSPSWNNKPPVALRRGTRNKVLIHRQQLGAGNTAFAVRVWTVWPRSVHPLILHTTTSCAPICNQIFPHKPIAIPRFNIHIANPYKSFKYCGKMNYPSNWFGHQNYL